VALVAGSLGLGLVLTAVATPLLTGRAQGGPGPERAADLEALASASDERPAEADEPWDEVWQDAAVRPATSGTLGQILPRAGRVSGSRRGFHGLRVEHRGVDRVQPLDRGRDVPPPDPGPTPRIAMPPTDEPATPAPKPASAPVVVASRRSAGWSSGAVPQPPAPVKVAAADAEPKRLRVLNPSGRPVVARVHGAGPDGGPPHLMLPDGQLGIPDSLTYSDEPFRPATAEEMIDELLAGLFRGFEVYRTAHYIVVYQSSHEFAEESGRVLENLYRGLLDVFRRWDVPVREAEFPLVAVIFRTERDFRAHKPVDPEVQAYYELYSNRISFYQTSEHDEQAPEVAAVRRPQTVAHEGTHQILQNIGIQPRLAPWPPWLVEGLAEYCATPQTTKRGTTWEGLGVCNAQHLATIRDLSDPDSGQVPGAHRPEHIGRPEGMPLVEYLVTKTQLTPTDYALSWALTHYLAMRRSDEFVALLKTMSRMPPLGRQTPSDHLATFRAAFGDSLTKLGKEVDLHLRKLNKVKDPLPYYAVMFQQRGANGMVKRAAIVSQSPSLIRQWLETVTSPRGEPPVWEPVPHSSRTRAWQTAENWVRGL
jgi:hypothetical protein